MLKRSSAHKKKIIMLYLNVDCFDTKQLQKKATKNKAKKITNREEFRRKNVHAVDSSIKIRIF